MAKNANMDLSGKSDDYVSARFDAIIEALPSKDEEALNKQREQLNSINKDSKAPKMSLAEAYNQANHGGKA